MHDTDNTAETLLVRRVRNFFASNGDACSALKDGFVEGNAVGGDSLLDDRKYLSLCIFKCYENRLVCMKMAEFGLLGAILNDGSILFS